MKKIIKKSTILLLALVCACSIIGAVFSFGGKTQVKAVENKGLINVYLIAGQSNAVGYGLDHTGEVAFQDSRFTTGYNNVLYYGEQERWEGSAGFTDFVNVKVGQGVAVDRSGAEIGIASALADTGTMNAVIKCAWGATHLYPDEVYSISYQQGTWTSPSYISENNISKNLNEKIGRMYTWWEQTVKTGLNKLVAKGYTPVVKGLWWMQGEAEMFTEQMSSAYDELLTALIGDMRASLSSITGADCSETPFVFGLPIWNLKNSGTPPYQLDVRDNMQKVANDSSIVNVDYVDCAGLFQHDDWHFDARGQKYLGEQFIAKLQTLNEGSKVLNEGISSFEPTIRFDKTESIRFAAKIANYNKANNYSYGMLIVPKDYLVNNSISKDYVNAFKAKNIDVLDLTCYVNVGDYDKDGVEDNYIQGTITDIKYKNSNRKFVGIGYIKDSNGNYCYTSAMQASSLSYMASEQLAKISETDENYQTLLNYVNAAINFENGVAEANKYQTPTFDLVVEPTFEAYYGEKPVSKKLSVTQSPDLGYSLSYSSKDNNVATVDKFGNVTGVSVGSTTITVKCLNVTKEVQVNVVNEIIDGVTIDAEKDSKYGTISDTVLLDGDRSYTISALKTNSGVFIYSKGIFNTSVNTAVNWYENTNFEFKLNNGVQSYVNVKKYSAGVTQFSYKVETLASGKYSHVVELFVSKDLINNWSDSANVQINYAWKTPGENAYIKSDMLDYQHIDWSTDWHSYHRLGGLETYFVPLQANLFASTSGLYYETNSAIDGVVSASEYPTAAITKSNANITVTLNGKVADGDLYLAFTITHSTWSSYDNSAGSWWKNDNAEIYINGKKMVVMFFNGQLCLPSYFTCGTAVTTTNSEGKLVTVLELYLKGDIPAYNLKIGFNSTGSSFAWLGFMWSQNAGIVTSSGVTMASPITLGNGVVLDGELTDSVWTEAVKTNKVSTTANGAIVDVMGTKVEDGVYVAITVNHTKSPDVTTDGSTNWYAYLNVELRLNNDTETQFLLTCKNLVSTSPTFGYCKTTTNADGTYTSVFEIFVPTGISGITASQSTVDLFVGGWYETGFLRLFGATNWNSTLTISATGITPKA